MEREEFEKRFMKLMKEKITLRTRCENALRNYFRFIDDHKIYQYKSYEQLLANLQTIRIQSDATTYLNIENARGEFSPIANLIMLKPNPNPSTFIHELTHALSSQRLMSFDCETFKKETAPEMSSGVYMKHHDIFQLPDEFNEKEEAAIIRWYKRNSYLFADTKTSRPVRIEYASGLSWNWRETSEYISLNKIYSNIKTSADMKKYDCGQIGSETCFDYKNSPWDNFSGITEGITELITKLTLAYSSKDGLAPVYGGYAAQAMLAAQLYSIFGDTLFEAYFTNQLTPLAKKLDLNEEKLSTIVQKLSDINIAKDEKDCEDHMKLVNEIQVDFIALFERKMLRELAKYKDDFQSPLDMRNAIISAFFDYSKVLHFGIVLEELVNPNFNDVWEQLGRSIKNCVEFGNKLLARRQKPLMNKIGPKTLGVFKNQNYLHYDYVGKNMGEITLSNRLAQFNFNFEGPSDECRARATKKQLKITQVPGEIMFAINNGADQTALYLYALGEDVDEELLKTNFERESKQNNKE